MKRKAADELMRAVLNGDSIEMVLQDSTYLWLYLSTHKPIRIPVEQDGKIKQA
jgi:hypothetical protein